MRYLKLFISMSLTYGMAMGFVGAGAHRSLGVTGLVGTIEGVAFGAIMTLVLWLIDRRRRKHGRPVGAPVRAARLVRVQGSGGEVRQACIAALQALPKAAAVTETGADTLKTQLGMTWWTWGDIVSAKLSAEADGFTQVLLVSVPKVRSTLVDYGKNADNLDQVVAMLGERFPDKVDADPVSVAGG